MQSVKRRPRKNTQIRRAGARPRYKVFRVSPWPGKRVVVEVQIDPETLEARVPRQTVYNPLTGRTATIPETKVDLRGLGIRRKAGRSKLHEAAGELAWLLLVKHK